MSYMRTTDSARLHRILRRTLREANIAEHKQKKVLSRLAKHHGVGIIRLPRKVVDRLRHVLTEDSGAVIKKGRKRFMVYSLKSYLEMKERNGA